MTDRYSSDDRGEATQLPADDSRLGYGEGRKAKMNPLEGQAKEGEIPQDEQDGKLIYDLEKQSTVGHGADVDRHLMGDAAWRLRVILGEEDSVYLPDGKRTTDTPPPPPPDPPATN